MAAFGFEKTKRATECIFARFLLKAVFLLLIFSRIVLPDAVEKPFDILIKGGDIIDGAGSPRFTGDIGLRGDRIVYVGPGTSTAASTVLNASGLVVAPGFIDMHTHCDSLLTGNDRANLNYLHQGVTTVKGGSCGEGPKPLSEYFEQLRVNGVGTNVVMMVGATDAEVVEQGMRDGAAGMSTGLRYTGTPYTEVLAAAKVVARYGGVYDSHIRNEEAGVIDAIRELIRIAEEAGLPANISHIKVMGPSNWGLSTRIISIVEEARARGLKITADQYPYTASSTSTSVLIPSWARKLPAAGMDDPSRRPKVLEEVRELISQRVGNDVSRILIPSLKKNLAECCTARGVAPNLENAAPVVVDVYLASQPSAIYFAMSENDLRAFMRQPWVGVGSDGRTGPYGQGVAHPRSYGTFPRVLGHYVREQQVMPLEEAVRKMTALAADAFLLKKRGRLIAGHYADVTVFDPATVSERADFSAREAPVGIRYVVVNGVLAVREGRYTGALTGKPLYGPGKTD